MTERESTCCFTGHRELPPEALPRLREKLRAAVRKAAAQGYTCFISGGALGFDLLAAETVLDEKKQQPALRLLMALPCANQADHWPAAERKRYQEILNACDEQMCLSPVYTPWCMLARDRWRVDRSALCICFMLRMEGGTGYTIKYAAQQELEIVNLAMEK